MKFCIQPKRFTMAEAMHEMNGGSVYSFPCDEWTLIDGKVYQRDMSKRYIQPFKYDPALEQFFYKHYTEWDEQVFNRAYYEKIMQKIKEEQRELLRQMKKY